MLNALVLALVFPNTGIPAYYQWPADEVRQGLDTMIRRELDRRGQYCLFFGIEKQYVTVDMRVWINCVGMRPPEQYSFDFFFPGRPVISIECEYCRSGFGASVYVTEEADFYSDEFIVDYQMWYPFAERFTYLFDPDCAEYYTNRFFYLWEIKKPSILEELHKVIKAKRENDDNPAKNSEPVHVFFCDYSEFDLYYEGGGFELMAVCESGGVYELCAVECNKFSDGWLNVEYEGEQLSRRYGHPDYPRDVYLDFCMNNVFDEEILYFDE